MTESGVLDPGYKLTFVNESTKAEFVVSLKESDKYEIGYQENDKSKYRSFDNPIGKLVIFRLPEGVYSLKRWSTTKEKEISGSSLKSLKNKQFRVMNGRSLYLGNLHLIGSETKNAFLILDNRIRDLKLFYKHYPQADKSKLLITSRLFLDPATGRERIFSAYTNCGFKNYKLFSKKRLPSHIKKFRTLIVEEKEKKVSRIDGFRLKYKALNGEPELRIKVELSNSKDYVSDKKIMESWFVELGKNNKRYGMSFKESTYFSEVPLETHSVHEKTMIYMSTMFDDANQVITNMIFLNPAEYLRSYKTAESFLPIGVSTVQEYQTCVIEGLNKIL